MKLLITYKCKNVYYIKGVRNLIIGIDVLVFLPLFNMQWKLYDNYDSM